MIKSPVARVVDEFDGSYEKGTAVIDTILQSIGDLPSGQKRGILRAEVVIALRRVYLNAFKAGREGQSQ